MNILILNVHSALNLGDDAIMRETLGALKRAFPQARVTVAANDPASWQKYDDVAIVGSLTTWVAYNMAGRWHARVLAAMVYLGLLVVAAVRYRLFKVKTLFGSQEHRRLLAAYYDADLVLSCGGGNFYAHHAFSPFFIWAILSLALAIYLGKRVIMLPQSIGPIKGHVQMFLARLVFHQVTLIMHREPHSLDFVAKELRIPKPGILLPDLAFGLPFAPPSARQERATSLRVGVTVTGRIAQRSSVRQRIYENTIEALLVRLSREQGVDLHIFAQCSGPSIDHDDRVAARRLYERLKQHTVQISLRDTFRDALEIKAAYAHMDCMIGTRMHTAIFAASNGVPVILIGYQPKAFGVMEWLGLGEYCCDIETITAERLYGLARKAIENREEIGQHVRARYAEMQARLEGWTRYLGN